MHYKSFLHSKRALSETITAILMLLIMFSIMATILGAFVTYDTNTQNQMASEQARSQEQIIISNMTTDGQLKITSVTINNTGQIEVKIRALYVSKNGAVTFLDSSYPDPSTHMSTYIAPGKSLTIPIVSGQTFDPQSKIIAATERGTKSMETEYSLLFESEPPPSNYNSNTLYAGPLSLAFNSFQYQNVKNGYNPSGSWNPAGTIPAGTKCAWKITITNIGNRTITLYKTSSFTTVSSGSQNTITWFIDAQTQTLPVNVSTNVMFVWGDPNKPHINSNLVNIYPQSNLNCMIFLTFYGNYQDTKNTPYAQTIPFEATTTT